MKGLSILTMKKLYLYKKSLSNEKWTKNHDDQAKNEIENKKCLREVNSLIEAVELDNSEIEVEINLFKGQWVITVRKYWTF